jgi:two-component system cell cycle response regulator DivK
METLSAVTRKTILVIEDDEKSRRLLCDVLSHQGYAVMEAATGEDGLQLTLELKPALVLMDIHLPGMSGFDALGAIRHDATIAHTPVVAVTASVMGDDRLRIRAAGFDGFQSKPVNLRSLLATVRQLTEHMAS